MAADLHVKYRSVFVGIEIAHDNPAQTHIKSFCDNDKSPIIS